MPLKKKEDKKNNIGCLLPALSSLLRKKGIENPVFEAEAILSLALNKDKAYLLIHSEYQLSATELSVLDKIIKDRLKGWSFAVIAGHKNFYRSDFVVDKNVLIPRPETELMVENIIKNSKRGDFIFDIGTGSGVIIISLAAELKDSNYFYASDKSSKALNIAKINAKRHKVKVSFLHGDLLQPYASILKKRKPARLIIAANLPYLTPGQLKEPSIRKEPVSALLSGSDGLWHYRRLFSQLRSYLKISSHDISINLYCEINPEQKDMIKETAVRYFPKAEISFQKDLSRQIRFCLINISHHSNSR